MKVSVETTSDLGRELTVEIPFNEVATKEQERFKQVATTIKMDGFRKGKVPNSLLKQKYNKQIHAEIISDLISNSLQEALKQEKLLPAEVPEVNSIIDEHGKDLQYIVKFEVYPEIELGDFKDIELSKFVADISAEDIAKGITSLQEQFATWHVTENAAVNGDKLTIDFVGSIDGVPFKNGDGKNVSVEIGANKFIPGFEEGLIGAKALEQREIAVTFPEEYGATELAGKPAVFAVTVHSVETKELAKIDTEFAKKIGIEDGDIEKINDKVKSNMEKYLAKLAKEDLRNQVMEKLAKHYNFTIPMALINKEQELLLQNAKTNNMPLEQDMEKLKEQAIKKVKLGLILNKIIKEHNLRVTEEQIMTKIQELAAAFGANNEVIQQMYRNSEQMLDNVKSSVIVDQAMDLIIEHATIKNISSTFYDIANRSA